MDAGHPRCTTPRGAIRVADHANGAPGDVCVAEKEQDIVYQTDLGVRRTRVHFRLHLLPTPSLPRWLLNLPETHVPHFEQYFSS